MLAYLICGFEHQSHRMTAVEELLESKGYTVKYITSDFDHLSKKKIEGNVLNSIQISAKPYSKNLSLDRILSHRKFARDVFKYISSQETQPDIIVAMVPPNFIALYGAKYKKKHKNVKLVFDIFDLWPETFPGDKVKKLLFPVFGVWGAIRDRNLKYADFITTECELFRQKLNLPQDKSKAIYLNKEEFKDKGEPELPDNQINLFYLGSINNIISIEDICGLIKELSEKIKVELHIIGTGEREEEFVSSAKAAGAEVIFYGPVFDDKEKQNIINKCHYGLNVMKTSVCVGLTMKSLDYFRHAIPIINNIPADTERLVKEEKIGVQLNEDTANTLLSLSNEDNLEMRKQVERVFSAKFETSEIKKQYEEIFRN